VKVSKWYLSSDPFESHLNGVYRSRIWRGVQGIGDEDRARRHDRRLSKAASERDLSLLCKLLCMGPRLQNSERSSKGCQRFFPASSFSPC